jgi:hypothetical protein
MASAGEPDATGIRIAVREAGRERFGRGGAVAERVAG